MAPAAAKASLPAGPIRFVWRTDAAGRFAALSDEFATAMGAASGSLLGRPFHDVAAELGLDPDGEIASLLERRDTWSGRSVMWPVAGAGLRVPVDLAALPVYGRQRVFEGFRGFGVARTADAVEDIPTPAAAIVPHEAPAGEATDVLAEPEHEPEPGDAFRGEVPALSIVPKPAARYSDKVISLDERRSPGAQRTLSPADRQTFDEIGSQLRRDLPGESPTPDAAAGEEAVAGGPQSSYEERYETLLDPSVPEEPGEAPEPAAQEPGVAAPQDGATGLEPAAAVTGAEAQGEAMAGALEAEAFDAMLEGRADEAQAPAEPAANEMAPSDVEAEQPWSDTGAVEPEAIDTGAGEEIAKAADATATDISAEPAEAQAPAEPAADEMAPSDVEAEQPWSDAEAVEPEAIDASAGDEIAKAADTTATEVSAEPAETPTEPAGDEMAPSDVEAEQPWSDAEAVEPEAIDASAGEEIAKAADATATDISAEPAEAPTEPAADEMAPSDVEAEQPWSDAEVVEPEAIDTGAAPEAIDQGVAEEIAAAEAALAPHEIGRRDRAL